MASIRWGLLSGEQTYPFLNKILSSAESGSTNDTIALHPASLAIS